LLAILVFEKGISKVCGSTSVRLLCNHFHRKKEGKEGKGKEGKGKEERKKNGEGEQEG